MVQTATSQPSGAIEALQDLELATTLLGLTISENNQKCGGKSYVCRLMDHEDMGFEGAGIVFHGMEELVGQWDIRQPQDFCTHHSAMSTTLMEMTVFLTWTTHVLDLSYRAKLLSIAVGEQVLNWIATILPRKMIKQDTRKESYSRYSHLLAWADRTMA